MGHLIFSGTIIERKETIEEAGERLLRLVTDVASGTYTKVETIRHTDPTQPYLKDPAF